MICQPVTSAHRQSVKRLKGSTLKMTAKLIGNDTGPWVQWSPIRPSSSMSWKEIRLRMHKIICRGKTECRSRRKLAFIFDHDQVMNSPKTQITGWFVSSNSSNPTCIELLRRLKSKIKVANIMNHCRATKLTLKRMSWWSKVSQKLTASMSITWSIKHLCSLKNETVYKTNLRLTIDYEADVHTCMA